MSRLSLLIERIRKLLLRWEAWAEAHPHRAWWGALLLVLLLVLPEIAYWPLNDYPGAMWHHTPRGIDIELVQDRAAVAGWKELAGYWTGRIIDGNPLYRPLACWAIVAEYHLFGRQDRLWSWVNIALHLANVLLLVWATTLFVEGSLLRRLATGVLAAVFFAAPSFADQSVETWTLGWWPSQPDLFSLVFGLLLLIAVTRYARTEDRRWAAAAPIFFFLSFCFKEMGFVAGLGACLLLVRKRRAWWLLGVVAGCGLAFYALRWIMVRPSGAGLPSAARLLGIAGAFLSGQGEITARMAVHAGLIGAGLALGWAMRRRAAAGVWERVLVCVLLYLGLGTVLMGLPWESYFLEGALALGRTVLSLLLFLSLLWSMRRWPVPELVAIYLICLPIGLGFPPIFAWHRYWDTLFGSLVAAITVTTFVELLWRLVQRAEGKGQRAESNELEARSRT